VRNGGWIFLIVPHKERTFDRKRERTTLADLIERHENGVMPIDNGSGHLSVWITEDIVELVEHLGPAFEIIEAQDADDKIGDGFTVVIKVHKGT
jgi:hypothetical protein